MTQQATTTHVADRLVDAIEVCRAPVCVGIDPVLARLPASLRPESDDPEIAVAAVGAFSRGVLQAVAGTVPCVKFQSACYERYRGAGFELLFSLIADARRLGLQVILDWKRGDIGTTADHYAAAAGGGDLAAFTSPDWVTLNSYLGADALEPFLKQGTGVFALVRTSNPSGDALQSLTLAGGGTVAEAVAGLVAETGAAWVGASGFSSLGAVVGATKPEAARTLRERMPQQMFLVPGFGAQGGGVDDVLPCFRERGRGALVTASRSVIYAFEPEDADWTAGVARAAIALAEDVGSACGLR